MAGGGVPGVGGRRARGRRRRAEGLGMGRRRRMGLGGPRLSAMSGTGPWVRAIGREPRAR